MMNDRRYDVIVVGGGLGGVCAACAAADGGARTLLVERYGFLGGTATAGMVTIFMSYRVGTKRLTTGIFNELLARLSEAGGLDANADIFEDEAMKFALDDMVRDHGVEVLFHSVLGGVQMSGHRIESVAFLTKSGRLALEAEIFIDSTGDGDLAAMAGAQFEVGREEDGLTQPMSLSFRIGNVKALPNGMTRWDLRRELTGILQDAKQAGEIAQPCESVRAVPTLQPTIWYFNATRVLDRSGLDAFDLTAAEIEGRRQVYELFRLFKARSPRFKDSYLLKMGVQVGVRETRRVMGAYSLTVDDIAEARKFDDGIARSNFNVDIHNPKGGGIHLVKVPEGNYYEVPYRCLVPESVENLLVGSRCVSATHEAHGSLRVMPVVAGMGEAAGRAAAKALQAGVTPHEVDGAALKREMFGDRTF